MNQPQRDRLLFLLLRYAMRNEVVIKYVIGTVGASMLSDPEALAVKVRNELQQVEEDWQLAVDLNSSVHTEKDMVH